MKKSFICLTAIASIILCGCSSQKSDMPVINSHKINSVQNYFFNLTADAEFSFTPLEGSYANIHFFNDSNVPYYNVREYFAEYIDLSSGVENMASYSFQTIDHKVIIKNDAQNETATIDFDRQAIIYSNIGGFLGSTKSPVFSSNLQVQGGEKYFVGNKVYDYHPADEYVIKLSDYSMKAYLEAGQGYLPYYLFRNVFQLSTFINSFFNGNGNYLNIGFGNSPETLPLINQMMIEGDRNYLNSKDLQEFNYNLFALTLDKFYGMKQRESRIDGHVIKYLENGAYQALAPFKERLMSTAPNVSNNAYYEIFDTILNDGGHSGYGSLNIFSTEASEHTRVGEIGHTLATRDRLAEERKNASLDPAQVLGVDNARACYQEKDNVAFLTFDGFEAPMETLNPANINKNNYFNDTISLVYYANKQIKEHNIKKLVLDLSCNTGGVVFVCLLMSSWLSQGNAQYKAANVKDGSYYDGCLHGDVNLNGKFDVDDYLDSSVKVYCITSNASFSCGNLLPTLLKDYTQTKFIGEKTGGGCCNVVSNFYTGLASTMTISYMLTFLRKESTADNFVTNENGVEPDFYQIKSDAEHAKDFYNRDEIIRKINADN